MIVQKFGLELRKFGNKASFYKEVDAILNNSKNIINQTVAHALQKMLSTDGAIYVNDLKNLADMSNIHIDKTKMQIYSAIHCQKWNEMIPEYRQTIMAMILDDFRSILYPEENQNV